MELASECLPETWKVVQLKVVKGVPSFPTTDPKSSPDEAFLLVTSYSAESFVHNLLLPFNSLGECRPDHAQADRGNK
jgi:hypothetical protein